MARALSPARSSICPPAAHPRLLHPQHVPPVMAPPRAPAGLGSGALAAFPAGSLRAASSCLSEPIPRSFTTKQKHHKAPVSPRGPGRGWHPVGVKLRLCSCPHICLSTLYATCPTSLPRSCGSVHCRLGSAMRVQPDFAQPSVWVRQTSISSPSMPSAQAAHHDHCPPQDLLSWH